MYPNSDLYIEDTRVTIHKIYDARRFKVKVHGTAIDKIYEVTDKLQTEILPNVRVTAGNNVDPDKDMIKLAIEAPRRLKILRGSLYRKAKK